MRTYFLGSSARKKKLTAESLTFRQLTNKLLRPKTLNMKREEYLALTDKELKRRVKDTTIITPCTFDPPIRLSKNAGEVNLLCIDIDDPKYAKHFTYSDAGAEVLNSLLGNLNYFAHTTATSTRENPKLRILIDAYDVPLKSYSKAVNTIEGYLGVKADKVSYTAVQPMYWPSVFLEDSKSPVIGFRFTGVPFVEKDIEESKKSNEEAKIESFSQPPVAGVSYDTAKEILSYVKDNKTYDQWIDTAAALKHQFADKDDEGLDLFLWWSKNKYARFNERECIKKWESFRPRASHGNSKTLRSLMKIAIGNGWTGLPKLNRGVYSSLKLWLSRLTKDHKEAAAISVLLDKTFEKMKAVPYRDSLEEELVLTDVNKKIKELFGVSYSLATIKQRWVNKLREVVQFSKPPPRSLTGWVYLAFRKVEYLYNVFDSREIAPLGFNRVHSGDLNVWLNKHTFVEDTPKWLLNLEGDKVSISQIKNPLDFALNYMRINIANGREYAPDKPEEHIIDVNGVPYLNTYVDTRPNMDPDNSSYAGELLVKHAKKMIGKKAIYNHFLDYLAYTVQYPGKKIRHAIYFQGFPGIGKNMLANLMRGVLGYNNVLIERVDLVTNFDSWKTGYQLVFLDDFDLPPGKRQKRATADKMKEPVANDTVSAERKFEDRVSGIRNVTNYVLYTNHLDALFITEGDRRYYCIKSRVQSRNAHKKTFKDGYFHEIFNAITQMPGAFRHFLMHYPIQKTFNPNAAAPITAYQKVLEEESKPNLQLVIEEALRVSDKGLVQSDLLSSKALSRHLEYKEGLSFTGQYLGTILRGIGYEKVKRMRVRKELHYFWKHAETEFDKPIEDVIKERIFEYEYLI